MSTESVEEVHRKYTAQKLEEILEVLTHNERRIAKIEIATAVLQIGYVVGAGIIVVLFRSLMNSVEAAIQAK